MDIDKARVLRIEIKDKGKDVVNIAIPIALIKLAGQFIPTEELEKYGINMDEVSNFVKESAEGGKIIDFEDPSSKTLVKVYLE